MRTNLRLFGLTLLAFLFATSHGFAAEGIEGLEAGARGVKRVRGRRGRGILIERPKVTIAKADTVAFDKPKGAVTFLLRPTGEIADAPGGVVFAAGNMALVKPEGSRTLELRLGGRASRKMIYDWRKGAWHHLALTWDGDDVTLYIDGRSPSFEGNAAKPERVDGVVLGNGLGATVFDEIVPLSGPLPPDEAARLAKISLSGKIARSNPIVTVTPMANPPTLDGVLEDGEWDDAAGYSNFSKHFSSRFPSANRMTRTWWAWDEERFYMAFRIPMTQPHGKEKRPRDKIRFGDKTVEIFFMPNPSGELEYFQLAFDSMGTVYDSRMMDHTYNPDWQVACRRDEEFWTAEVAVPYKAVNALDPEPGHRWKTNVVATSGQWSPSGTFHEFNRFGMVKFAKDTPSLNVGTLARKGNTLAIPYRATGPGGELTLKANVYPSKGIEAIDSARKTLTGDDASGELTLDLGEYTKGLVEIVAFQEAGDPLYHRFIEFYPEYFGAVTLLKDLPEEIKNPEPKKVEKDAPADERKKAQEEDWRPTVDEIEQCLVEQQRWLGNDIGKSKEVPEPWTPMRVDGDTFSCWAKRLRFGSATGMPRQVTVLDREMLRAPMTLTSNTPAKAAGDASFFVIEQSATNVKTIGIRDIGDVRVTTRARTEFDGFTRYDVTLSPLKAGATLDGLTLEIPYTAGRAKYFHMWGGNAYGRSTKDISNVVPADGITTGFEAFIWIGDDDRGFCWFAEAPENWSHPDDRDLMTVTPTEGGGADLAIRILKGKQAIVEPVTLTFGTMATPAKPRPKDWRLWEGKLGQDWWWYTVFSFPYPPRNPETFRKKVKDPNHLLMMSNYFAGTVHKKTGHPVPEQWLWGHLWSARWKEPRKPYGRKFGEEWKIVSYSSQSMASHWPDYYLYKFKELREKYGARSVYLDTCIRMNNNPFSGMTWTTPEGETRGKIDIFAFREAARRIYTFVHEDPEAHVMMHHSNQVAIPILSFMDSHMNGEHFNTGPHQVKGRHYSDPAVLPPEAFRASYTLKQWGIPPQFLPEHPVDTRAMMGYFWAHDTTLYRAWCDHKTLARGIKDKQTFEMVDVEFLPYWRDNAPVEDQPENVFVSGYRKTKEPGALLIAANMTGDDRVLDLRLIEKNLGVKLAGRTVTAEDIEFGETFEIRDGKLELPVMQHDFRMIRIGQE